MEDMNEKDLINSEDIILVTGSSGFIGARVVSNLLKRGFRNIRCFTRETSDISRLKEAIGSNNAGHAQIIIGNLLSREDCSKATQDVSLIYHLAAGTGTKAFSEAFLHSVVTTRNLLDEAIKHKRLRRFVNLSSFAVYTNRNKPRWRTLDERCPTEDHPESRAQAYTYGKIKQDELVAEYGERYDIPYVTVRPGTVYGPGKSAIPGRIGIDTFGFFLHLGGPSRIPFTYVDNCADAIVLAGLIPGIEREVFNIVDDHLPSSRHFLRLYKTHVKSFKSIYMPHVLSYTFCSLWESFSKWSKGQVPPAYTRREWAANWKKTRFSNRKSKDVLGWSPRVSTAEGLRSYFAYCREARS